MNDLPRRLLLGGLVGALAITAACRLPPPAKFATQPRDGDHFCILGDVRRPHPAAFWMRSNDAERDRLVQAVAKERPAFVAMTGDFVFYGSSAAQWAKFDRTFAPLRRAGIGLLPALGNHEFIGADADGLNNYFARFPGLGRQRWYRRDFRGLALLVLDSNHGSMSGAAWRAQRAWFARHLSRAEQDPRVRAVLVFLHHPPYTNSRTHADAGRVHRDLVPLFFRSPKTLALVAGHVHSYERFVRHGKTFLNSGGGGARQTRLYSGNRRRHMDDKYPGDARRPLHYVSVRFTDGGLSLTVKGLHRGAGKLHLMERFFWAWPARKPKTIPAKP